jgi:hypothetical protein
MHAIARTPLLLATVAASGGLQGCWKQPPIPATFAVNSFTFIASAPTASDGKPRPGVWIDANTTLDMTGGTLTSSLPCAVKLDYTDSTSTFEAAEITSVSITYDDGVIEPSLATLQLPLRINGRDYESVNSVAGGRIVRSVNRIVSGEVPGVVTRAEPFTLILSGSFITTDGRRIEFTIDQHFDIKTENAVKNAADVLQDK